MKKIILRTIAVISILALSGCGLLFPDKDEDYSGSFTADTPVSGAGGTVTLQENRVSGDQVYLDVYVEGVTDMLGASLKINYDPSILDWGGSNEAGSLLEGGGSPNYLVNDGNIGELIIGVSLSGGDTAANGNGVLITVPFRVVGQGESTIGFFSSVLTDSTLADIAAVTFNGGSIVGIKSY